MKKIQRIGKDGKMHKYLTFSEQEKKNMSIKLKQIFARKDIKQ